MAAQSGANCAAAERDADAMSAPTKVMNLVRPDMGFSLGSWVGARQGQLRQKPASAVLTQRYSAVTARRGRIGPPVRIAAHSESSPMNIHEYQGKEVFRRF